MRTAREPRTISRYGLRGSRVGEASNPGPPHLRRFRRESQSRIDQSPDSSDELLVPPNMSLDVFPRVDSSPVTVPLTEVDSIVSPTVSPVPNMSAIQQTLVDTDSEDGGPPVGDSTEDVINALKAVVGCVAPGRSSRGTPRSIQDRQSQPCGSGRLSTRMEDDVGVGGGHRHLQEFRACTW